MSGKNQRKVSVSKIFQTVIHCALLSSSGFGQRCRMSEIRFYVDLYTTLLFMGSSKESVVIQSVQIMRILEGLAEDQLASIIKEGAQTYYSVSPRGALYLLKEMVSADQRLPMEDVVFINYYLTTYRSSLMRLDAVLTSSEEKETLKEVLKPGRLIEKQLTILDELITKLDARQADYTKIRNFIEKANKENLSVEERIKSLPLGPSIPQTYKKSLREVLLELPEPLRENEVNHGFEQRRRYFIVPYARMLADERALLASLLPKPA